MGGCDCPDSQVGFSRKTHRMRPDDFDKWMSTSEGDFEGWLYGRLSYYPTLRDPRHDPPSFDDARGIANEGAARARLLAREFYRAQHSYFDKYAEFVRWGRVMSWRQALRLVLNPERIDHALHQLP